MIGLSSYREIPPAPLFTRKEYAGGCPAATQRPFRSQRGVTLADQRKVGSPFEKGGQGDLLFTPPPNPKHLVNMRIRHIFDHSIPRHSSYP